jgi:spore maturation protein CgeB
MARSRVVLNVNANFGAGSHERPLCGMNAGAAAASDVSAFYAANFKVGEEIALYRWRDLEAGLAAVAELAKDAEAAFAMAQAGQRRVVAEHRWINRVETVIAAAEAARRARS